MYIYMYIYNHNVKNKETRKKNHFVAGGLGHGKHGEQT